MAEAMSTAAKLSAPDKNRRAVALTSIIVAFAKSETIHTPSIHF